MTDSEFAVIVGMTKSTVLSAVRRHLAARFSHAVDDVVQETYLRGYRHLTGGKFRQDSSVGTWLYAIARNESLRMNERLTREEDKARRAAGRLREAGPPAVEGDGGPGLAELAKDMPGIYRDVLLLKGEGMAENEIARRLGIRAGTVKSRLSRAREMLKKITREVQ